MSIRERFKIFLNKEDFDYSHGEINPYDFHTTFYFLIKMFRVIDNEPLPKWSIMVPTAVVFMGSTAAISFTVSLWEFIIDFDFIALTETGTYVILMIYKLLMVSCPITNKKYYHKFLQGMRDDFKYICTKGIKYREKYFELHLNTWKASILSSMFMTAIGGGMVAFAWLALIFFIIFRSEGSSRPLPFPLWVLGFDDTKTPTYELVLAFSITAIFTHTSTYIFILQTQIVWSRQITAKADVIIWRIEDLLEDIMPATNKQQKEYQDRLIINRMSEIIQMHQSMYCMLEDYAAVHAKVLMYEQKLCAPVVCLTAFCAAEKFDRGEIPTFMVMLCVAVVILSCIPSYMCTILAEKMVSVGDACWDCPFWNAPGLVIRPYLILIMQRSVRQLPLTAPGFTSVSLETFASNLSKAYSWFNMLRQADMK